MNTRFSYIILAVAIPLLILSGCAGFSDWFAEPEARIESIDLESINFDSVSLLINVEIDNPNSMGLTLDAYDYGVDAWDTTVVEGRQEETVSLKAQGTSILPIPVRLDFKDLMEVGGKALTAESVALAIRLGLEIEIPYVSTVRLDLSGGIDVPIPKAPKIVPTRLQVERITLFGAEISLLLDMENPNSFGMNISNLEGSLFVGDREWGNVVLGHSIDLAAGGRETAIVSLQVSFTEVGQSAVSILKGSGNADVSFDGTMDIDMDLPGFTGSDLDWDAEAKVSVVR